MARYFFFVFVLVILTIANGTLAEDAEKPQPVDNKLLPADNSTKALIDSLGPSQDYPDYEIPKELAPHGVEVVGDYVPISPTGGLDMGNPLAQPEADMNVVKPSPTITSSASRSSLTVLTVSVAAAGGAASFFFF